MDHAAYPDAMNVADARLDYFRANGFGDDGGYSKKIDWIALGPLRVPIPNIPARVYALRFHDLHHVLTGYQTDLRGEFEISAWELAAGCRDAWFAWLINMGGLVAGLLVSPARTLAAFLRGSHSRSLYDLDPASFDDEALGPLRRRIAPTEGALRWRARDVLKLVVITAASVLWAVVQLAVAASPLVLLWLALS